MSQTPPHPSAPAEAGASPAKQPRVAFARNSPRERRRLLDLLRVEATSGILLITAAVIGLIWANSPWGETYANIRDFAFGPESLHLHLSVGEWAADGLLAVFFFMVGLELKREFVAGDLRNPATAVVPVTAAFGGVVVPALIFAAINFSDPERIHGWAIPTATDIAFAVAILALVGKNLPSALRIFLLTLAVVDDLIAIVIIAMAYTEHIHVLPLALTLIPFGLFAFLTHRFPHVFADRRRWAWLMLLPLGVLAWSLLHASGIHATIAGVVMGLIVPVVGREATELAEHFEHRFQPLSTAVAIPLFALFSAGVSLSGGSLRTILTDPVTIGIVVALVLGKPIGIFLATFGVTSLTKASLDPAVKWLDVLCVGGLAGIGFTVSLLVTELSFEAGTQHYDHAKIAVLGASTLAAVVFGLLLRWRGSVHARLGAAEED